MNRILSAFILICFLSPFGGYAQGTQPLRLKHGIVPYGNDLRSRRFNADQWQTARSGDQFYVILRLDKTPDAAKKALLSEHGIKVGKRLNANTYLAVISTKTEYNFLSRQSTGIYALPSVSKIDPRLKAGIPSGPDDVISLRYFPGTDPGLVQHAIARTGASIRESKIKPDHTFFIRAESDGIRKLAKLPFVVSLSPLHLKDVLLNNNNRAIHGIEALASVSGRNLQGRGITVGIGDNADPSTHVDLAGKLIMRTDEPVDFHGTHTAGTIAGGGILNPLYRGMAPHARLIPNDFSNIIVNSPNYFRDFGMTLSNNSYYNGDAGCPGEGEYNSLSSYADEQLIAYPKILHVFAAGNDGNNTCSPYPASFATVKSGFQVAKNVLVVGNLNAYNNTPSPFSSRGPVNDGRLKPEIIAGGSSITSTIPNNQYGGMSGTSMATPTVTGALAVIEERYHQLKGADPDGALMKILLCNNATDWGNAGPDYTYGFGIMNARTAVEALEQNRYIKDSLSQGETKTLIVSGVPPGTSQVKIMLYWADPAAEPLAAQALVNDLDLVAADASGSTHLPLILNPAAANVDAPAVEGTDRTNNIEQIVLTSPATGNITVQVKGSSVIQGPQTYYVTWEFIQPSVTVEFPSGGQSLVPATDEYIHWNAYGAETSSFTVDYSLNGGSTWTVIDNAVPATARTLRWTVPAAATSSALVRVVRNGAGIIGTSDNSFTIIGQPVLTIVNACRGYAQLKWNTVAGTEKYEISKLTADSMRVIAVTNDTSFLVSPLNKDSLYWFSVNAVTGGNSGRRALAGSIVPSGGPCSVSGLNKDLIVDPVTSPTTGRAFTSTQLGVMQIVLPVRNSGAATIPGPTTFNYQVNGGAVFTEVYPFPLGGHLAGTYGFSPVNNYDFSAPGTYVIKGWIHNNADTVSGNDTSVVTIKQLRNDPVLLAPSFTEGFETALPQTLTRRTLGLDSLDRADFGLSNSNGRGNTFFNSGFPRNGNRSITLDVSSQGTPAADSLITTYNLSNYTSSDQIWLDVYYKKQSSLANYNGNRIWIRGSDNAAWIRVKNLNNGSEPAGTYLHLNVDVSGTLAAAVPTQAVSSSFQVRLGQEGYIPAASSDPAANPGGGISYDDITLTRAQTDAAMRRLLTPVLTNMCDLSPAETISVLVRNYSLDTMRNIPVTYVINNDTVTENISLLNPKDSIVYSFVKTKDMSAYGTYTLRTWVSYPSDNYQNNDTLNELTIQTSPVINSFPYLQNFESNDGYWYSAGQNNNWQWGTPAKTIIHKAASGDKAWATNLTGNYSDNQYSFLYSPCFDLSAMQSPVFSFSHIFKTEDNCDCDFHWIEYSIDDSNWVRFGQSDSGINWYDNPTFMAWQKSQPYWRVSSYDVPVNPAKIRFRVVMYADAGTNNEGVAIDDIHVFEKAAVYADSSSLIITKAVSDSGWTNFDKQGHRLFSINPGGQHLGNVTLHQYLDSGLIRDTAGQYYLNRNWVLGSENPPTDSVEVRFYFTESEMVKLISATSCPRCLNPEDAYSTGLTEYGRVPAENDSTLRNNLKGNYLFYSPLTQVQIIPYDNGYYAQLFVKSFSEFRLNGGGKRQDHPLAAWLNSFSAAKADTTAVLNWGTWQEADSAHFVIERSADSLRFSSLARLAGTSHTDSIYSHRFTDNRMLPGADYYRILYLQGNGDSLYSQVLRLDYQPKTDSVPNPPVGPGLVIGVYPNPTDGPIHIITSSNMRRVHVLDASGRLMLDKPAAGKSMTFSVANLSRGIYIVEVWTGGGKQLVRIEKR